MARVKYPIIVQKHEVHQGTWPGMKRYSIFCMAPFLNAFNEVIQVRFEPADPSSAEWMPQRSKDRWGVSKGSSGEANPEETALVAEGYAIALKLMKGDESVVTPEPKVKKFLAAYWAKQKRKQKRREKARWEERRKAEKTRQRAQAKQEKEKAKAA